ncbi:MAG: hypothetical protein IPN76_33785 [Saprospiraceae bacterium]|nr:hypothetical protein [Saprospiraceae bacterium]
MRACRRKALFFRKGQALGGVAVAHLLLKLAPHWACPASLCGVENEGGNSSYSLRYSEDTADRFLNKDLVHGASSLGQGLQEISLPYAHARFAVHFDWGAFDEYLKSFEGGIAVDAFFQGGSLSWSKPPVDNNFLFINLS